MGFVDALFGDGEYGVLNPEKRKMAPERERLLREVVGDGGSFPLQGIKVTALDLAQLFDRSDALEGNKK